MLTNPLLERVRNAPAVPKSIPAAFTDAGLLGALLARPLSYREVEETTGISRSTIKHRFATWAKQGILTRKRKTGAAISTWYLTPLGSTWAQLARGLASLGAVPRWVQQAAKPDDRFFVWGAGTISSTPAPCSYAGYMDLVAAEAQVLSLGIVPDGTHMVIVTPKELIIDSQIYDHDWQARCL